MLLPRPSDGTLRVVLARNGIVLVVLLLVACEPRTSASHAQPRTAEQPKAEEEFRPAPLLANEVPRPITAAELAEHEGPCRVESPGSYREGVKHLRTFDADGRPRTWETVLPRSFAQSRDSYVCSERVFWSYDTHGALIAITADSECWSARPNDEYHKPVSVRLQRDDRGRILETLYSYETRDEPERIRISYDWGEQGLRRVRRVYEPDEGSEVETEFLRYEPDLTERTIRLSFLVIDYNTERTSKGVRMTRVRYHKDASGRMTSADLTDVGGCHAASYVERYMYDARGRLTEAETSMVKRPDAASAQISACEGAFGHDMHVTIEYDGERITSINTAGPYEEPRIASFRYEGERIVHSNDHEFTYSGSCPNRLRALEPQPEMLASDRLWQLNAELHLPGVETILSLPDSQVYAGIFQFK